MIQGASFARNPAKAVGLALAGAALLTLSAKTQVPFWPVPMTLQTMAVLLIATVLGPRLGMAAMVAYLGAGMAGLPVFAGSPERGIGLAYLAGPTGGFLAGMALAMLVTGVLAQQRGFAGRTIAMLAGVAAIYLPGLAWLSVYVPADKLIATGFAPFILGDLFKVAVATMLVQAGLRLRG
ncbi:biotin transporter BioY [Paracoccus sp. Z330]|uniref:Biotin transporter n=2 Tax=Paracoccus onchidii TaxID=3017813 RepID=A0ABT4ZCG0_9RHOB|nr:biotin transporter BioY [Paracoccus onchidii]MDB6177056.1 biotin transporter BioY [Paracoccus onchidii]